MSERIATAEWANPEEFARTHTFKAGDFWLGRSITPDAAALGHNDDRHICLVSGSRGGKGTTSIINNLCLWPGSVVVIDPKGENANVTARRRGKGSDYCEGMGQDVHVLDPFETTKLDACYKSSFNPLDALDPKKEITVSEANRIADALVLVQNQKDPFWEQMARTMVHALILHVLTAPEFEGERNLLTVRKLLMRGDWKAAQALEEMGEKNVPPAQHLLWVSVKCNKAFDVLAGLGAQFVDMAVQSAEQFQGVVGAAMDATRFLDDPQMKRCLETSDFKISDLKTNPKGTTLYLCLPQYFMNSHSGWLRMMIALTIYDMQVIQEWPACGHRVLICLDEFAGLKKMDIIEDNIAQIAGFGVKLFIVLQSLEQLKGTYDKKWETFLSNCGLKIFFDLGDHFSREYVSKFIGETEQIRETYTVNKSVSDSESSTHGKTRGSSRSESSSQNQSTSFNRGTSESKNTGTNWGANRSNGWSSGTSDGSGWKPHPLLFRNTSRYFSLFRSDETANVGHNASRSGGGGESWGGSDSVSKGSSESFGHSQSQTFGTSVTQNESFSDSTTRGRSESSSRGTNETILKRPLITPDEIGRHFSRIDSANDPRYPGFALVLISGHDPIPLRRTNYFQEPELTALYDPHPQHPETIPEKLFVERPLLGPPKDVLDRLQISGKSPPRIWSWRATENRPTIAKDQTLLVVLDVRGDDFNIFLDENRRDLFTTVSEDLNLFDENASEDFTTRQALRVNAPVDAHLSKIVVHEGPLAPDQTIAIIKVNRRKEYLEQRTGGRTASYVLGFTPYLELLRLEDQKEADAKAREADAVALRQAEETRIRQQEKAEEEERERREFFEAPRNRAVLIGVFAFLMFMLGGFFRDKSVGLVFTKIGFGGIILTIAYKWWTKMTRLKQWEARRKKRG